MLQRKFLLSTEQISKDISYFTIGFATLSVQGNVEDAVCAGSGTLVTVGSLHGILTAAHVLGNLPTKGQVGLVTHADDPTRFQKQVIMMEHTDSVVMRGRSTKKAPTLDSCDSRNKASVGLLPRTPFTTYANIGMTCLRATRRRNPMSIQSLE